MKNILFILALGFTFSLNAQVSRLDKIYLDKEFDKSLVGTVLFIDKVTQPKIDNIKFIQAAIDYCNTTGKCVAVNSEYPRQIPATDLTKISFKGIALKANLMITSR